MTFKPMITSKDFSVLSQPFYERVASHHLSTSFDRGTSALNLWSILNMCTFRFSGLKSKTKIKVHWQASNCKFCVQYNMSITSNKIYKVSPWVCRTNVVYLNNPFINNILNSWSSLFYIIKLLCNIATALHF